MRRVAPCVMGLLMVLSACSDDSGEPTATELVADTTGPTAGTAVAVEFEAVKNVSYDELNALDVYIPIDARTARRAVLVPSRARPDWVSTGWSTLSPPRESRW